jgi:fructosamine-3-kinase
MSVQRLAESIVGEPLHDFTSLSGGCIHSAQRARRDDGSDVAVKSNTPEALAFFEEEVVGLRRLAETKTLIVPEPFGCAADDEHAVIVMQYLPPARADAAAWQRFAEKLAALHLADAGERYGFDGDNHLGPTPQPNSWYDDWIDFNADCRLGHQLKLNRDAGRLSSGDGRLLERLIDRLGDLIPDKPHPSLLHGDLWSGNAMPTLDEAGEPTVSVIDPACYVGDALADIAMMQLFGGFPQDVYGTHADLIPEARTNRRERLDVYQLYHLLNHLHIFGPGYHGQVLAIARRYA